MSATNHSQSIKQDSKEYLTTALLQLLQDHDFYTIKITQLVARAGVSRMAFYRNFDSLEDVLTAYFEPKLAALFTDVIQAVPHSRKQRHVEAFFDDFSATLRLAEKRHFEFILQRLFNANMIRFYEELGTREQLTHIQQRYWVKFMSAGVYTIWREWFLNGRKESLAEIHALIGTFQQATMTALQKPGSDD